MKQKAFHPNASRINLNFGKRIFAFKRISKDKKQIIICITNLSSKNQKIKFENKIRIKRMRNLMNLKTDIKNYQFMNLKPFETLWLSNL